VLFSNDGQKLISGGSDRLVQVWEMKTGKLLRTLAGHGYGVTCGALSQDGRLLVTGSWDRTVRVWDIDSFEPKGVLKGHTGAVETIALSPDGKTIATGGADRVFRIWDVATQKANFCSVEQELSVRRIAFSPDGKLLATGTGNASEWKLPGEVKLWNAESGEEQAEFSGHSACVGVVVFSPDSKRLATGTANGELRIFDIAKRTETSKTNLGTGVRTVAFLADDRTLAIGQWPGHVFLWDMPTQKRVTMYTGHEQPDAMVDKIALSPDGSLIASTGTDGMIYFWAVPQSAMKGGPPLWRAPKDGKPPLAELVLRWEPR
jgi:WD40 repeat protein